ncbi:probable carbohydrate esterase At4g34215 [Chenopodium quinoa]|uniref:probable carbohydrate esterase At4g34215 n=1 Tax=Chenopodium quinoa TaxID=63459 RepID=UPI000B76D2D5|nr:probable carbohydrate esterase At4g34215 [Chenopodium quinoa]
MSCEDSKEIFILSGQSNMSGRGGVIKYSETDQKWDSVVPPECQPNPSILRFSAQLLWEEAHEPLHVDIDTQKVCGVGPGMPFAHKLIEHEAGTVGLVPCAVGASPISEWARGTPLYKSMVKRSKAAVRRGGDESEIKALVWYQGESDTLTEHDADEYKDRMEEFICNVREDLQLPLLPIIQVALASGVDEQYTEKVREAQLEINLPNVICVDAKGLKLKDDNMHLTTESQVHLGQMLADAYLSHF